MKKDSMDLFIDKIRLSALTVDKEGELIGEVNDIMQDVRDGFFSTRNDPIDLKRLNADKKFKKCLSLIGELYHWLKYNKIAELKHKYQAESDALELLIGKVFSHDINKLITLQEFCAGYEAILQFVSLGGYHDDLRQKKEELTWDDIE